MLIRLDREGPENLGVIITDYLSWLYLPVFTVLKVAIDDDDEGLCMLLAKPAYRILHSMVDIACHCTSVKDLLLSCHNKSLGVFSDVAFIEALI